MDKRYFTEKEKKAFRKFADDHAPKRNLSVDLTFAFCVGGAICLAGQGLFDLYGAFISDEDTVRTLVSVTLIFLSCLFTGIGLYDSLAKYAGAGTLVPITGFANAVCAPAIDSRAEGYILGVASKMFIIAGPVIVYGCTASVLWGILYYFIR